LRPWWSWVGSRRWRRLLLLRLLLLIRVVSSISTLPLTRVCCRWWLLTPRALLHWCATHWRRSLVLWWTHTIVRGSSWWRPVLLPWCINTRGSTMSWSSRSVIPPSLVWRLPSRPFTAVITIEIHIHEGLRGTTTSTTVVVGRSPFATSWFSIEFSSTISH